ncbi:MAG: helix-hairpin-helix domain-containing protein [Deltaproteobacteria bacterium]|nr:helix-hairpin-helix domain-containing protein [Deltaproteobacteria bacterium]
MKTFSKGQQVIVLLIIFGMTLLYFNAIDLSEIEVRIQNPESRIFEEIKSNDSSFILHPSSLSSKNLSGSKLLTLNKRININKKKKTDLEAIRGIGPMTAEKIVEYRQWHGRFKRVEDLKNVTGIKEKGLEKVKKYLTVE